MMAKEKSDDRKKDKKDKKRSEADGISKSSKKDKKNKKSSAESELSKKLVLHMNDGDKENAVSATGIPMAIVDVEGADVKKPLLAAMVPFANPLADEKQGKKVLKGVKKAAKNKTLKRGVKEVVKALRKSPTGTATSGSPIGVVVLAADISPMDVISHIPVLCEDHGIPYLYVPSRAELGAAGATKRPTSVVMISGEKRPAKEGKKEEGDSTDEWKEAYADLVKVVLKASKDVKV